MALSLLQKWFGRRGVPDRSALRNQADTGGAEAQFLLGQDFARGEGVDQDYLQAARWYRLAAEQNHRRAQFQLAMLYGQGQGVTRDEAQSLSWMARSARLGEAVAQYTLGVQLHLANRRTPNPTGLEARIESLMWVRLSAAQGYRAAEGACEFVAMGMTREEVAEGGRRVASFVPDESGSTPGVCTPSNGGASLAI